MADDMDPTKTPGADGGATGKVQASKGEEDVISIFDLLIILSTRKGLILGFVLLGGVLAGVLALITPPTYTAMAVIMPPQQQSSSALALLQQLGGVAGLASPSLGVKNPADIYVGILSSRTLAYELIAQFGLRDVYGLQSLAKTRKRLASMTNFNSSKYSLIQISVIDRSPTRAADLANAYVDQLQKLNSRLAVTEASQRRLFFENQLEAERNNLAKAEAAFKKMQEKRGVFQVDSQVEAIIRSMAQIRAEIAAHEVNMQRLQAGATTQNPEVLRQEIELKALRSQLQELEASTAKRNAGDPFMPTNMVPAAGLEYAQRLREVKYREALFEILAKQYEAARIDEAKEAPLIQVVDRAVPAEEKTAPSRRLYVSIGILLGGVAGIIAALFVHFTQAPLHADKVTVLKESLWMRRKA